MYSKAEAERQALEKMGPSNQSRSAVLSLAARSVMSKKDKQMMEEESKLLEKYYQDYYGKSNNLNVHQSMDSIQKYIPSKPKAEAIDSSHRLVAPELDNSYNNYEISEDPSPKPSPKQGAVSARINYEGVVLEK